MTVKRQWIAPDDPDISIAQQCALVGMARSSHYYQLGIESEENLELMRLLDEQHLQTPFYGRRRMTAFLRQKGYTVNGKRVLRLLRLMGLAAVGPKPNLSKRAEGAQIYPYLLREFKPAAANEVWCSDITYVPMPQGFMYLVAVMDWHSRFVLSWALSNSQETCFCLEALDAAIGCYGKPDIFNTDQGPQFTSKACTEQVRAVNVKISMDGVGRATDNAFIERLWRSLKYECVYLHAFEDGHQLYQALTDYFQFYNYIRPHQGLKYLTPASVFLKKDFAGKREKYI